MEKKIRFIVSIFLCVFAIAFLILALYFGLVKCDYEVPLKPLYSVCGVYQHYLGGNIYSHVCTTEKGRILDIRFFIKGKPTIKGITLTREQFTKFSQETNTILNALMVRQENE